MKKLMIFLFVFSCSIAFSQPISSNKANLSTDANVNLKSIELAERIRAAWADITGNLYASGTATIETKALIGTTTANLGSAKLEVLDSMGLVGEGDVNFRLWNMGGGDSQLVFCAGSSNRWQIGHDENGATDFFRIYSYDTVKTEFAISDGGNTLLGTTNDDGSNRLQVNGSIKMIGIATPSGEEGAMYFNSSDKHFYGYNGTAWVQLDN